MASTSAASNLPLAQPSSPTNPASANRMPEQPSGGPGPRTTTLPSRSTAPVLPSPFSPVSLSTHSPRSPPDFPRSVSNPNPASPTPSPSTPRMTTTRSSS